MASAFALKNQAEALKFLVTIGLKQPVEAFATFADDATTLFQNDIRGMMWGVTNVLMGFDPNITSPSRKGAYGEGSSIYFVKQNWLPYRNNPHYDTPSWKHSLRGDWNPELWDKTANQAYHFWFYVSVAFFDGAPLSFAGNLIHDNPTKFPDYDYVNSPEDEQPPIGVSKPDYLLGNKGVSLGWKLRQEYEYARLIDPYIECNNSPFRPQSEFAVGAWLLSNLRSTTAP